MGTGLVRSCCISAATRSLEIQHFLVAHVAVPRDSWQLGAVNDICYFEFLYPGLDILWIRA